MFYGINYISSKEHIFYGMKKKNIYIYIYSWIYQNVAQENLATLASTPQNQAIKWSNEPEIHAKERKESRKDGEREREKKKTEHPYVFISPTLETVFERQKAESVPNWPIRLGRIDAGEWLAAISLEPVLINPGIYSSAIIIPVQ